MKIQTLFSFILIIFSLCLVTSCGGEDEPEPCQIFPLDGEAEINGDPHTLTLAQLVVNAGGAVFGDTYIFQFGGANPSCTEIRSINISVSIPAGSDLNGTHEIKDFFSADDGDAYGSFITQVIDPITQSAEDLISGTVQFTKNGPTDYTIDLSAETVTGQSVDVEMTYDF